MTVSTDIMSTVAGSSTSASSGGYSGDGGAATSATLKYPYGVVVDPSGNSISLLFFSRNYSNSFS